MKRCVLLFAPALALGGWAVAAAWGADPEVLRVAGPAVTAAGSALHILEEIHLLERRGR